MFITRSLAHLLEAVAPFAPAGGSRARGSVHLRSCLGEPDERNTRHAAIRRPGATESHNQQPCRPGAGSRGIWFGACLRRVTAATS